MKLLFSILLGAVMAASVQAVTVAWTLQNSYWIAAQANAGTEAAKITSWTGVSATEAPSLEVFVFFAAAEEGNAGLDAAGAAGAVADGTAGAVRADYAAHSSFGTDKTGTSRLSVFKSGLNAVTNGGYYYMVIFSGKNEDGSANTGSSYAVAKTEYIAAGSVDKTQGVYNTTAGTVPDAIDYVTLEWMAGSTWDAPKMTPEPTVMALLALGVAGLALRRKNV